ncbi:MAG TPA: hypothetical protein VGF99_16485 [Myxococcota bacterium]
MPKGYGDKPVPMFPPGFTDRVTITALDPAGVHRTATFAVDERGIARPDPRQPGLGHLPYRISADDADGHRYSVDVDITPGRIKVGHTGYEAIEKLTMRLAPTASKADAADRSLDDAASDFARQQGAPKTGMSPLAVRLQR